MAKRGWWRWGIYAGLLGLAAASPARAAVRVTNFRSGETVRYPVPLLAGSLDDASAIAVTVTNTSSKRATREMKGLALGGKLKALAELVPGENRLVVRAGKSQAALTLVYKPQTNPRVARVIYFTGKAGETAFQTPLKSDRKDWRGKLDTAMKLMQCFTADRLARLGFGRRTFNLELDAGGKVDVHLLKGGRSADYYRKLSGSQLYCAVAREVARKLPNRLAKNLVIPAMTRFDPNTGKVYAHTALGGGNLALFGGGDLFTWPDSLAEAQRAFMNDTPVDPKKWFSDSVGRHTFWAICSTTMGAALHELGHTFGLPHSRYKHDIMTRGHDRLNRFFTLIEPPHARKKASTPFKDAEVAQWMPVSGGALAAHRHFAMDRRTWRDERKTTIRLDRSARCIVIESPYGIRYVGVLASGPSMGTIALANVTLPAAGGPIGRATVPLAQLGKPPRNGKFRLKVMDGEGLATDVSLAELTAGPFVQAWRFASVTVPWANARSFPKLDAAKFAAIQASATKARLVRSPTPYVDFLALSGSRRRSNVAGYALRKIHAARSRKVKIHTGSDDALRVWLNGKLIQDVLALRGAQPDSEAVEAELIKGDNRLLIEVAQGIGGWGLILRLADANGATLDLKDDGKLVAVPPFSLSAK
jgi:hypothetical protein